MQVDWIDGGGCITSNHLANFGRKQGVNNQFRDEPHHITSKVHALVAWAPNLKTKRLRKSSSWKMKGRGSAGESCMFTPESTGAPHATVEIPMELVAHGSLAQ